MKFSQDFEEKHIARIHRNGHFHFFLFAFRNNVFRSIQMVHDQYEMEFYRCSIIEPFFTFQSVFRLKYALVDHMCAIDTYTSSATNTY